MLVHVTIGERGVADTTARAGALEGSRDRLNLQMVRHIIGPTRANRQRYRYIFESAGVPAVFLASKRELREFYDLLHA